MNNNDNSQSLLRVKNVTLKPNFKTKSLNFLDFNFYYFKQQKFVLRWRFYVQGQKSPITGNNTQVVRWTPENLRILSNHRKSATQKRENHQLENAENLPIFAVWVFDDIFPMKPAFWRNGRHN